MTLTFAVPCNIVLEIIMISIQAAAYHYASNQGVYARIDQIFFVVVAFLVASIGCAWYFYPKERTIRPWMRGVRYAESVCLIIIGALMIWSAVDIESSWCGWYSGCQKYELKLTAGVLALLNAIFYMFPPCKFVARPVVFINPPQQQVFVAQNVGGVVLGAPPSYFQGQQQPAQYYNVQYAAQPGAVQIETQQMPQGYYTPQGQPAYPRQS